MWVYNEKQQQNATKNFFGQYFDKYFTCETREENRKSTEKTNKYLLT